MNYLKLSFILFLSVLMSCQKTIENTVEPVLGQYEVNEQCIIYDSLRNVQANIDSIYTMTIEKESPITVSISNFGLCGSSSAEVSESYMVIYESPCPYEKTLITLNPRLEALRLSYTYETEFKTCSCNATKQL